MPWLVSNLTPTKYETDFLSLMPTFPFYLIFREKLYIFPYLRPACYIYRLSHRLLKEWKLCSSLCNFFHSPVYFTASGWASMRTRNASLKCLKKRVVIVKLQGNILTQQASDGIRVYRALHSAVTLRRWFRRPITSEKFFAKESMKRFWLSKCAKKWRFNGLIGLSVWCQKFIIF